LVIPLIASEGIQVTDVTDFSMRMEASSRSVWTTLNRAGLSRPAANDKGVEMPQISSPNELFTHKLGAALTMEQTVLQMLQKLEQTAKDPELKEQFSHHRDETEQQV
jgi:hypothetical protein